MTPPTTPLAAAALAYAAAGIPVLPVHTPTPRSDRRADCSCSRSSCPDPGKHPRPPRGLLAASTEVEQVTRWWRRWPTANIGARTGVVFDVCDLDSPDGATALRDLLTPADAWPPTTPLTTTGRGGGGWHLLYAPSGYGNRVNLLPGVDWRGAGGFVILPPSLHPTGRRYRWHHPLTPGSTLPAVPASLLTLLTPPAPPAPDASPLPPPSADRARQWALAALEREAATVAAAPPPTPGRPGGRNHALNRAAFKLGQLLPAGLLDEADVHAALAAAAARCGLEQGEVERTIIRALAAGRRRPRTDRGPQ